MVLAIGSRLGPYEISSAIGTGGMGEVYRDRDSKLGRDVALKVRPEAFARDADRLARFEPKPRSSPLSIIPTSLRSTGWKIPTALLKAPSNGTVISGKFRIGGIARTAPPAGTRSSIY